MVDMSDQPSGIYYLLVQTKDASLVKKITKR